MMKMSPIPVTGEVWKVPTGARPFIANITVSDNAYAHIGDNIYNYPLQPDARKRKLALLVESLTFTRMGARERNVADAISDTCEWLFERPQFCAWANSQDTQQNHGFFWIKGKPGTGKSTLVKKAMNWVVSQWPDEIVLSYFFSGRSPNELEQTTLGVYRTLLYQLLSSLPDLHDAFLANFAAKEQDGQVEPWEETELQNFLLRGVCSEYTKSLVVFIDAMDEGHEEDVERMILFLEELASRAMSTHVQLRLCLSSRHYPRIEISHSISITLEHEAGHFNDIETYIRSSFPSSGASTDDLLNLILDRSQGFFIWVVLVIPLLKAARRKGKSAPALVQALEIVPKDLHELFDSLLSRNPEDGDQCLTLLQWVLYSFESISPDMLCAAITFTLSVTSEEEMPFTVDDQETYLLHTSRGLIESIDDFDDAFESGSIADSDEGDAWLSDPVLQTVQFIHQTVLDYLLGKCKHDSFSTHGEVVRAADNHFRAEFCHAKLARTCLEYLACLAKTTSLTSDTLKDWPLAPYAAKFWWKHTAMSGTECDQSLVDLAARFLIEDKTRQVWVQLYDMDYPTDLSSAEVSRWGRQVLKHSSFLLHRPGPLCFATMLDLPRVVEAMMLTEPDPDVWNDTWGNALQVASSKQAWFLAEQLLKFGIDPDARLGHRHSGTPLQLASFHGIQMMVQLLIDHGADVNASSARLATPLQEASSNGHYCVVQLLIDHGAEINVSLSRLASPLQEASSNGHHRVAQLLVDHGAKAEIEHTQITTHLREASKYGNLPLVQKLISCGADLKQGCENTDNALFWAFEAGHDAIVRALLLAGVRVGDEWDDRWPVILRALLSGRAHIVRELISAGLPIRPSRFESALETAFEQDEWRRLAGLFVAGRDIFGAAWTSMTGHVLMKAVEKSLLTIVESLLIAGVHPDATYSAVVFSETALMKASAQGSEKIVKLLLDAGADVNIIWSSKGEYLTTLMVAVLARNKTIVEMLLDAGADINTGLSSNHGLSTALMAAVSVRDDRIVEMLLNAGARLYSSNLIETFASDSLLDSRARAYWTLDRVLATNEATWSDVLRDLFRDTLAHSEIANGSTTPLQFATEYWLSEPLPAIVLRFVDFTRHQVLWSSPQGRPNPEVFDLQPLWNPDMLQSLSKRADLTRALYDAAMRNNDVVIQLLVAHGIDIGELVRDSKHVGSNPLFIAAKVGHTKLVELLIANGAFLSVTDICCLMRSRRPEDESTIDKLSRAEPSDLDSRYLQDSLRSMLLEESERICWSQQNNLSILRDLLAALQRRNKTGAP